MNTQDLKKKRELSLDYGEQDNGNWSFRLDFAVRLDIFIAQEKQINILQMKPYFIMPSVYDRINVKIKSCVPWAYVNKSCFP